MKPAHIEVPATHFRHAEDGIICLQHAPEPPIKDPAQSDASKGDVLKIYSMEEVEKHETCTY